jgi:hypothetical protein
MILFVCEALSLSARQNLVTEKGPCGPSFLVINSATVKNVYVPLVEFFPLFKCQGLLLAPMLYLLVWAQCHRGRCRSQGHCEGL